MDDSIGLQIAKAVQAQLELETVQVHGVTFAAPAGLQVERGMVRDVQESDLATGPMLNVVYHGDIDVAPFGSSGATVKTAVIRVEGADIAPDGTPPEDAVDPLRNWVIRALMANPHLDVASVRLAHEIEQKDSEIYNSGYMQSSNVIAGFDHLFHIRFHSRTDDPAARS